MWEVKTVKHSFVYLMHYVHKIQKNKTNSMHFNLSKSFSYTNTVSVLVL